MHHIAVIDYGMGNLRSVSKALEAVSNNASVVVTSDPKTILSASHVLFPGVGAIRDCMAELKQLELEDVILQAAQEKPFLGICLGMQALLSHSEENSGVDTLNLFSGSVKLFRPDASVNGEKLKVPHMGWNQVHQTCSHPLWKNIEQNSRFYFVHSFYAEPIDKAVIAGTSAYPDDFAAALYKDNIFAAQFHPEKSQRAGLQLLENFVNWDGQS
ncbi:MULTISPECIES: imidazole glycerol phosphate synthase subunit HisH [unclassified Methylophaga]|jgi:glutamine amidotransferase|uniref:imidazole glycerol phosphate synthase subunit HisH n=1 Tax=unclassified Methylophaga TaxID=2629249 RepID=UPI00259C6A62|nr:MULTISPECIES: imidazole glycerol phosphate synthase subunit HisH [unclassified Methylophaga]|tara:strand:- start:2845 stop:3486 length:642 start_codon:yes stop_codon:yes gene_type:complete